MHVNPHTSMHTHTHSSHSLILSLSHTHTHTSPTYPHTLTHSYTYSVPLPFSHTHLLVQVAESTPLIYTKAGPLTDSYTAPRTWRRESMLGRLAPWGCPPWRTAHDTVTEKSEVRCTLQILCTLKEKMLSRFQIVHSKHWSVPQMDIQDDSIWSHPLSKPGRIILWKVCFVYRIHIMLQVVKFTS